MTWLIMYVHTIACMWLEETMELGLLANTFIWWVISQALLRSETEVSYLPGLTSFFSRYFCYIKKNFTISLW